MKARRTTAMAAGAALLTMGLFAAPSVEITAVQQQYPWTNTVDITYEVRGVTNMEYFVRFTPTTSDDDPILNTEGEASIQVALESNGVFTTQWYPQTNLQYTACKMTPAIFRGGSGGGRDYLVIDLEDWSYTYEPMATQEASNERYNTTEYKTRYLVLRKVEAGDYKIGHSFTSGGDGGHGINTQHTVTVPEGTCYYIGVFPVTIAQYVRVMNGNKTSTDIRPQTGVSWNTLRGSALPAAKLVANKNNTTSFLIRLSGLTGLDLDLPTEEMWEIAARAETTTLFPFGDSMNGDYAWHSGNSGGTYHDVGSKKPNDWGLYDIVGNTSDWCLDVVEYADMANKKTNIYTPMTSGSTAGNRRLHGGFYHRTDSYLSPSHRDTLSAGWTGSQYPTGVRVSIVLQ